MKTRSYCIIISWYLICNTCLNVELLGQNDTCNTASACDNFEKGYRIYQANPGLARNYFITSKNQFRNCQDWVYYIYSLLGIYATYRVEEQFLYSKECVIEAYKISNTFFEKNHYIRGFTTNAIGDYYASIGDYTNALIYYEEAISIILENKPINFSKLGFYYNNLGAIYHYLGDEAEAIRFYLEAIKLKEKTPHLDKNKISITYTNLGNSYDRLGDYQQAIQYYKSSFSILGFDRTLPVKNEAIRRAYTRGIYDITQSFVFLQKLDSASHYLNLLPSVLTSSVRYRPQVEHELRAEIYSLGKDYSSALNHFKEAHSIRGMFHKGRERHIEMAESYQRIADTYAILGFPDSALQQYQMAILSLCQEFNDSSEVSCLPRVKDVVHPLDAVPMLDLKAKAFKKRFDTNGQLQDLELGLAHYLLADSLVHKGRNILRNAKSKLFLSQKVRPTYEHAIELCMTLYELTGDATYLHHAFFFSEKSKAAVLHLDLQDAGAKLNGGLPDTLINKERQLKVDINFYQDKIFQAKQNRNNSDSDKIARWEQQLFALEQAYRQFIEDLEVDFPDYYRLKYDTYTISAQEVIETLPHKQAKTIAYFWGDSTVYAFCLGSSGINVHQIPHTEVLDSLLRQFIQIIRSPQADEEEIYSYMQMGTSLYHYLLAPVLPSRGEGISQIAIIPDGELGYLPFEALLTYPSRDLADEMENARSFSWRNLPYLLQKVQVRYGYSATLLYQHAKEPYPPKKKLTAFAPSYDKPLSLSFNQPQATEICQIMEGDAYLGLDATEESFKAVANQYDILHLGMHGIANVENSLYAYLLFNSASDSMEDGKLNAYELYNMQINAQLTVLAACETGFGKLEKGEGIMSLARAFQYAGCPSIVTSLWKADGRSTGDLMMRFYKYLDNGENKSFALQRSQKEFLTLSPPDQTHPHYWATFILIGDDQPIGSNRLKWWIIGAGIILLLCWGSWQMRGIALKRA